MTLLPRASALALAAGLALALAAAPAPAQNALGDGTALDRNLMRGGTGKNTRVRDLQAQINFNNAIVTGNAPFGRSIRGGGQYRSPGEFSGTAGSNSLFRFERDAFASGLAASGARGTDALRYQFALATGTYVPTVLGDVGAVTVRRTGTPQGNLPASSALRSTADYLATQAIRPSMAGYRRGADGTMYTAAASPLMGIGWLKVDTKSPGADLSTAERPSPADGTTPPLNPGQPQVPSPGSNPSFVPPTPPTTEQINQTNRQAAALTGLEPGAAGMPGSLQSSALLNLRASNLQVKSRSEEHSRLIRAIDTAYDPSAPRRETETERDPAKPEADRPLQGWEKEMASLRERLSGDAWLKTARGTPSRLATPLPGSEPAATASTTQPKPDPEPADTAEGVEDPTLEFHAQALGIDVKTMKALRDAGVRFERLSDPALADQPAYRRHMAAGEQLLGAGRFFDAEDRFLRAMSTLPGDPMAQVGRLHAQIGAGLFLSAALNLRQIFAEHPEMVAAKYGGALRPDADRASVIATNLREELGTTNSALGRDAALLLAYLGHITDQGALVKEGLKELRLRTPADDERDKALITLLEGVWSTPPAQQK